MTYIFYGSHNNDQSHVSSRVSSPPNENTVILHNPRGAATITINALWNLLYIYSKIPSVFMLKFTDLTDLPPNPSKSSSNLRGGTNMMCVT
jgi:hypothetical protein